MTKSLQVAFAISKTQFVALRINDETWEDDEEHDIVFFEDHAPSKVLKRVGRNVSISRAPDGIDGIAIMSQIGKVEFLSFSGQSLGFEDITGFLAKGARLSPYGFLNSMTCIEGRLLACGMGGQVYIRKSADGWDVASELLSADHRQRWFSNIQGPNLSCILVDGLGGDLYHYDKENWKKVDSGTDFAIGPIVFVNKEKIYIGGAQATLLQGNLKEGFRVLNVYPKDLAFYGICYFDGRLFLGTQMGLYEFDMRTEILKRHEVVNSGDIFSLQVVDEIMWCFATKFVLRYDKRTWMRFDDLF